MTSPVPPREITLRFADGSYLFRLPAVQIAQLQTKRGVAVTYPDGASGIRPKAFGTIWREHATGEYDPLDSREIVLQALIGGGEGLVNGETVKVGPTKAVDLVEAYFDREPAEDQWKFATSILMAVAQGYVPPKGEGEDGDPGNAEGAGTGSSTSPGSSETEQPAADSPPSSPET